MRQRRHFANEGGLPFLDWYDQSVYPSRPVHPTARAYLRDQYPDLPNRIGHYPQVTGSPQPMPVMPRAMVRRPEDPAALMAASMAAEHLDEPSHDPAYAPTAPGIALSGLVTHSPDMRELPAPLPEPVHGLVPPSSEQAISDSAGAFGDPLAPDLYQARRQARHETMAANAADFRRRMWRSNHPDAYRMERISNDLAGLWRMLVGAQSASAGERR